MCGKPLGRSPHKDKDLLPPDPCPCPGKGTLRAGVVVDSKAGCGGVDVSGLQGIPG